MSVLTYSPGDVALSCGGFLISGFVDGTFIVVEREADAMTKVVGADGEVSRTRSANKSGSITVTLKQTSLSNKVLAAKAALDEASSSGTFPVTLKDNLGNKVFGTVGWVRKHPNPEYGTEESNREWIIDCERIVITAPPDAAPV